MIDQYLNKIHNCDCLEFMKSLPDKCVDLVLTDPPYGIGASSKKFINGTSVTKKDYYADVCWDTETPKIEYFNEIFRISKNQVIWGGNYFISKLKDTRCFLIWDKTIHGNSYADCELAWTSFDQVARIKSINMVECTLDGRIHPTQKPRKLFKWILENYSSDTDIIFDPFMGSGTTAVAAYQLGRRWFGCERSEEYYKIANARIADEMDNLFEVNNG
jgi:site-specific DNA-methyltransferase (adenine-specific)